LEDEGDESEEEELMSIISLSSSLIDRFGVSSVDGDATDDDEVAGMEPGIVYVLQVQYKFCKDDDDVEDANEETVSIEFKICSIRFVSCLGILVVFLGSRYNRSHTR
jgi:hypothetical protein